MIDAGEVLSQDTISVQRDKSVFWHTLHSYEKAAQLISLFFRKNQVIKRIQCKPDYYSSWPNYSLYKKLRARGFQLFSHFV